MTLYERLQELCHANGITIEELCEKATGNKEILVVWKESQDYIRSDYLLNCANILGCTIDFVLGKNENASTSLSHPEIKIKVCEVFSQENAFTRYASYLREAQNELYNASFLFSDVMAYNPFRRHTDLLSLFRYNSIVLCETAEVIFLGVNDRFKERFSCVLDEFLKNNKIRKLHANYGKLWRKYSIFFKDSRHNAAHFDHERRDYFGKTMQDTQYHIFQVIEGTFSDAEAPLYFDVLITLYKETIQNERNEGIEEQNKKKKDDKKVPKIETDEQIFNDITKIYGELLSAAGELLSSMVNWFFENYVIDENNILILSDKTPVFPIELPKNPPKKESKDSHSIDEEFEEAGMVRKIATTHRRRKK